MAKFSREEYETILCYDFVAKTWSAYTNIPSTITKFKNQGWTLIQETLYEDGAIESCRFEAPKAAITIGKANRKKRVLSEEHKARLLGSCKKGDNDE